MIVLAIAGLILAIVFIAVPALQRNSRDAQRRADISGLQSAIATYVGNNNGSVPSGTITGTNNELAEATTSLDFSFYNVAPAAWTTTVGENGIFAFSVTATTPAAQATTGTPEPEDYVLYLEGAVCQATANAQPKATPRVTGATTRAPTMLFDPGPSRSYAIIYAVESNPNWICIDNV